MRKCIAALMLLLSTLTASAWEWGAPGIWFTHDIASGGWDGTIGRNASYAVDTGVLWLSWEGAQTVNSTYKHVAEVTTYNSRTGQWTANVVAGPNNALAATDGHGAPTFTRDPVTGCAYIPYGAHITDLQLARTTNPNDPSAWTASSLAQATYGPFTFPRPFVYSGKLYIFFDTSGVGIGQEEAVGLISATINSDCSLTWGNSTTKIIDVATAGVDGWVLPGSFNQSGTKIQMAFSYGTFIGHLPLSNIYFVSYDLATGAASNFDGSVVVQAASLPLSKTTLDASYKLYASTQLNSCKPDMVTDDLGITHIVDCEGDGSTFERYFEINGSDGFAGKHVIYNFPSPTSQNSPANIEVTKAAGGGIAVYFPDYACTACTVYAAGAGNMMTATRAPDGTWSSNTMLLGMTAYGLVNPEKIENGPAWARVMWAETSNDGQVVVGNARGTIYGDSGFLRRGGAF